LQSPKLQRQMAEHNFAAGVEMTMANVVDSYLRWFELNKAKRTIRDAGAFRERRRVWLRSLRNKHASPDWSLHSGLFTPRIDGGQDFQIAADGGLDEGFTDPFRWLGPKGTKDRATDEPNDCP
jgi:hypothetical protein